MSAPESGNEDEETYETFQQQSAWRAAWQNNKGAALILISECFGSSMDAIVRFLQQGGHGMHPFQVIFARMITTLILSGIYMWWTKVPNPFGHPSVRHWLVLRAIFGFSGLFCLYYSVHYLPLAEATVFRFLVPIVTAWACSIFLGTPFTRKELIAGLVALIGVVMIAHPSSIFGSVDDIIKTDVPIDETTPAQRLFAIFGSVDDIIKTDVPIDETTPAQRLFAIFISVIGIFGASGAYTTIRVIGNRAHALVSVSYFAALGTVGSAVALLVIPGMSFTIPHGLREWALLAVLGIFGFGLQFLLTAGLQLDRSSKATSMMYTQVLFALSFDWAIWGVLPGGWSLVGGSIVIASTLWSALQKTQNVEVRVKEVDEESALLGEQRDGVVEVVRRGSISA